MQTFTLSLEDTAAEIGVSAKMLKRHYATWHRKKGLPLPLPLGNGWRWPRALVEAWINSSSVQVARESEAISQDLNQEKSGAISQATEIVHHQQQMLREKYGASQ